MNSTHGPEYAIDHASRWSQTLSTVTSNTGKTHRFVAAPVANAKGEFTAMSKPESGYKQCSRDEIVEKSNECLHELQEALQNHELSPRQVKEIRTIEKSILDETLKMVSLRTLDPDRSTQPDNEPGASFSEQAILTRLLASDTEFQGACEKADEMLCINFLENECGFSKTQAEKLLKRDNALTELTKRAVELRIKIEEDSDPANQEQAKIELETIINDIKTNRFAVAIQKRVRGHKARKPFLPRTPEYSYGSYVGYNTEGATKNLEKPFGGASEVYLPPNRPLLLKKGKEDKYMEKSARDMSKKRFHQMQEVRTILREQKSSHLTLPRANLSGDFLVEEKLPISGNHSHNMEVYSSAPELFDDAVREMVRLFSRVHIADLINKSGSPFADSEGFFVRYDNLPFYTTEKNGKLVGKIALIDVERMSPYPRPEALAELARMFPYHLDIIKEEAEKQRMEITPAVEAAAQRGKKSLDTAVAYNLWLKQKEISAENNPLQMFELTPEREQVLIDRVREDILRFNRGEDESVFFKTNKKDFLEDPETEADIIAKEVVSAFKNNIKRDVEELQEGLTENEKSDLTVARSPVLNLQILNEDMVDSIQSRAKFRMKASELANKLIFSVSEELVRGGEIFAFSPMLGNVWFRY